MELVSAVGFFLKAGMMVTKRGREWENCLYESGDGGPVQGLRNVVLERRKKEKLGDQSFRNPGLGRRSREEWGEDGTVDGGAKRMMMGRPVWCGASASVSEDDDDGRSGEMEEQDRTTMTIKNTTSTNNINSDDAFMDSNVLKDGVGAITVHLPPGYHHHRHDWYHGDIVGNPSREMAVEGGRDGSMGQCMAIVPYVGGGVLADHQQADDEQEHDTARMDVDS